MVQNGHWPDGCPFRMAKSRKAPGDAIDTVNLEAARREVAPFVADPYALSVWFPEFFTAVTKKVKII